MQRNLLNYTTEVPVSRTIAEIQEELVKARATSILTEYEDGEVRAILFKIRIKGGQDLPFKLPARVDEAYRVMYGHQPPHQVRRYGPAWKAQAARTAWRILLTWLKGQLSLIALEMAKPEEVFLPYLVERNSKTVFENYEERQFLLPERTTDEPTS
jgi:hypothetical protein